MSALGLLPLIQNRSARNESIRKRTIPATQEELPVVGLGTWQTFDVGGHAAERDPLKEVLRILTEKGGTVIDSSPMYGRSEQVVGELSQALGINKKLFMATKVWTTGKEDGIRQMKESLSLLKRSQLDLMQIHNLSDWQTHLPTLRKWKEEGIIRYIGITHYTEHAYASIERIMKTHPIDFLQVNYSLQHRKAEERLLPLAQEKRVAVLINQPFESGNLFRKVKGKPLPAWCVEFDCNSWAQFFLKFIVAHPAVTCVIPGTAKPHHMLDNIGAAYGNLPTDNHKKMMIKVLD